MVFFSSSLDRTPVFGLMLQILGCLFNEDYLLLYLHGSRREGSLISIVTVPGERFATCGLYILVRLDIEKNKILMLSK